MIQLILDLLRKFRNRSEPKQQKITLVIGGNYYQPQRVTKLFTFNCTLS